MDASILEKAKAWANNPSLDEEARSEIRSLLESGKPEDQEELVDRFYRELEFGTAGLRGKIGSGSNRINPYNIRKVSQGLANYINQQKDVENPSVAIAFDCRKFSDVFTQEAARVFAANGLTVHVYPALRPTPMLSFAVRELNCTAGIVITASHNPPDYNGYKVYWSDGCQITDPHDKGITECVQEIQDFSEVKLVDYKEALDEGKVKIIEESLEEKYFELVEALSVGDKEDNKGYGVVYTPLHGTGCIPVQDAMARRGFDRVCVVPQQQYPDGNFPTVAYPNPEDPAAFQIARMISNSDEYLILGNDPDADRIGAQVREGEDWVNLNGNQIGQLFSDYYFGKLKEKGQLPEEGYYAASIVTSELGKKIAESYGVKTVEVLTGFKHIGKFIQSIEGTQGKFLFGTEEANGYLFGDFVRDKDGISACVIFAELCAELHKQGKTPLKRLQEIYQIHGYHEDSMVNQVIEGKVGAEQIQAIMRTLRANPPQSIAGHSVKILRDYQKSTIQDCQNGEITGKIDLPQSNVLAFYMEDGSRITVRPSGTEPKIKFYFNLVGTDGAKLSEERKNYEDDFVALIEKIKSEA